ncbi:hypothetical protein PSHT_10499 [Puccinia striiformis]|uniref:Uncharacterized protein n=1 Tax=Puccinia striiformis TaxID=27350 RepID=A0A2S4V9H2_9BASI|nr:hypothetical protein PSHT_10499 [Puccinia striiformis]
MKARKIIHHKMVASSIMINDDSETKLGGPDNHALGIAVVFESMYQCQVFPSRASTLQRSKCQSSKRQRSRSRGCRLQKANWMWVYNSMRIALDGFNKPILVYPGSFRSVESPTLTITPDRSYLAQISDRPASSNLSPPLCYM